MRRDNILFLFVFFLALQITNVMPVTAITYQWTDDQGKIHTSDDPGKIPPGVMPIPVKKQKLIKQPILNSHLPLKNPEKDMVLIPAGIYERYAPAKRMFKVKSKKGNDLWINDVTAGYAVINSKVSEKYEKALKSDPGLKEKLNERIPMEMTVDFTRNQVAPLKIGNALWIQFGLPKVDYNDPLEIDYIIEFPNEISLKGKKTSQIQIHEEYNAAYLGFEPGGTTWMFDEKDDPALLQTGEWSITLFNKGKKITSAKFLVVSPGNENEVSEATVRALKDLTPYQVSVDPFYMDRHEVTRKQYLEVMGYLPSMGDKDKSKMKESENLPADSIMWEKARDYCKKSGKHLPTEAEWEWAARGGKRTQYPWGRNMIAGQANFCDRNCSGEHRSKNWNDGFSKFAPVGSFPPNGYGLYDMSGNQSEWVSDWYDPDYYASAPENHPVGPSIGHKKVFRGGSYLSTVNNVKTSTRSSNHYNSSMSPLGFRCALSTNGTLKQIAQARYLEEKPKNTSRDYGSMTPTNRLLWKARDALHLLNKACKRFWKKRGRESSCTVKRVTGAEFGFENPYQLSIQAGGNQKKFKASITQVEENFKGEKEKITYLLNNRGRVQREPPNGMTHVKSTVWFENMNQNLQMRHEKYITGTSCGTKAVPIATADWECKPSGETITKSGDPFFMFCSRPYSCRKATPQEEKRLFDKNNSFRIIVALNRLQMICGNFFKSEKKKDDCSEKDLNSRALLHYKDVKITFHGKGDNLKVTATRQWKDKDGKDAEKTYHMNHKGEITPMDY